MASKRSSSVRGRRLTGVKIENDAESPSATENSSSFDLGTVPLVSSSSLSLSVGKETDAKANELEDTEPVKKGTYLQATVDREDDSPLHFDHFLPGIGDSKKEGGRSSKPSSRPHSANSMIADVIKNTFSQTFSQTASATQLLHSQLHNHFTLCGANRDEYADEDNNIPFSYNTNRPSSTQPPHHDYSFPLRHTQSSPMNEVRNFKGSQMKRSNSTPATFQQSSTGSAFGRVSSATSPRISSTKRNANDSGSKRYNSAFDPVWSSNRPSTSRASSTSSFTRVSASNEHVLVSSNVSSKLDSSLAQQSNHSTPAQKQRNIKALRRERRQKGRDNVSRSSGARKKEYMEGMNNALGTDVDARQLKASSSEEASLSVADSLSTSGETSSLIRSKENVADISAITEENSAPAYLIGCDLIEASSVESERSGKDNHSNVNEETEGDLEENDNEQLAYLPLDSNQTEDEDEDPPLNSEIGTLGLVRLTIKNQKSTDNNLAVQADSPPHMASPVYQRILDEEQPLIKNITSKSRHYRRLNSRTPPNPPSPSTRAVTPQPRLVLPHKTSQQDMSPSSHDSCAQSRTTSRSGQSINTANQTLSTSISGTLSCARSVTSSVAEADREVMETNRRERRRREHAAVDMDGTVSIHSSDTASTNTHAYLALAASPAPLREGASMPVERFLSSGGGNNFSGNNLINGIYGRPPQSMNARSPVTVSSNSLANTNSSGSTGEEPPEYVAVSVKGDHSTGSMPPRSRKSESKKLTSNDGVAYSKLGSGEGGAQAISSSSKSFSSKSSSSSRSSKKKDKTRKYQKMSSTTQVSDRSPTPTPSPCFSIPQSPIDNCSPGTPISPPSQFIDTHAPHDLQERGAARPNVVRKVHVVPKGKMVLVSPERSTLRPVSRNLISSYNLVPGSPETGIMSGRHDFAIAPEPSPKEGNSGQRVWHSSKNMEQTIDFKSEEKKTKSAVVSPEKTL